MKTITEKQPWASLIVEGIKDIENRTWKCPQKYIGKRVLIHASMGLPMCMSGYYNRYLTIEQDDVAKKKMGVDYFHLELQTSAIIGSVEIVDCVINHSSIWAEKSTPISLSVGDVVPYKNSRGNIEKAEITSFKTLDDGRIWFWGIDIRTKAEVWYPTHISLEFMGGKPIYNWVLANPINFPEPIPCKGKLSFWDYPNILAEPEEEGGELYCHCNIPVEEENQVTGDSRFGFYCRYCGGKWYK